MTAKNELVLLIDSLTSTEWLWLERFLASPYYNSDQRLVDFWRGVRASKFKIERATLYPQLFPQEKFDARKWNDVQRKFLGVLRSFLQQEQIRKEPILGSLAAINARTDRKLYKLADEQILHYTAIVAQSSLPPWEQLTEKRRLWQKRYESYSQAPDIADAYEARRWNQVQFCLLELRFAIEAAMLGKEDQEQLFNGLSTDAFLRFCKILKVDCPILELYLVIFQAFRYAQFTPEDISHCETAFYKWYEHLHIEDQSFFFVKLSSLLNRSMGRRHPQARERYFELQRFGFSNGIFLRSATMHLSTFLNICMIGCALGELEWVEQFRAQHLPYLRTKDQQKAQLLSDAHLAFGRGEYAQVYKLSSGVSRLPKLQRLQFYGLQIKALTERYLQEEIGAPLLSNYLRSAKAFVQYHSGLKNNYLSPTLAMISFLQKLVNLRERGVRKNEARKKLVSLWKASPNINAGEWLREKIDQY